jgi:hypothetical protein
MCAILNDQRAPCKHSLPHDARNNRSVTEQSLTSVSTSFLALLVSTYFFGVAVLPGGVVLSNSGGATAIQPNPG